MSCLKLCRGTQVLLRTLGRHRTMRLVLTGDPFSAADAFAMGVVSELVDAGSALPAALANGRPITHEDVWTFARDVSSRDPNWKLVATEAGQ